LVGGFILVGLYWWEGSYKYAGLGFSTIQQALHGDVLNWSVALFKGFFTAVTVGSGFKGGEFVPLVFMGATLGSAMSVILPATAKFLSAIGFVALFAGASNTPIACTVLAMELFGYQIGPYALVGCFASYYFSGRKSIYPGQL